MTSFAAAITGIGLVTPAGIGVEENWQNVLKAKKTAAHDSELTDLPVDIACRVPGFSPARSGLRKAWQFDRYAQFAIVAARDALADAGYQPGVWADSARVAVVIGSGAGGTATLEAQHKVLLQEGPSEISAMTLPMGLLNMAAGQLAIDIGANGPCLAPCSACASGASAIGLGREMLRTGVADIVIAGGAEAPITPCTRRRSPAHACAVAADGHTRDGVPAFRRDARRVRSRRGAGVVVLESEEHARARGVRTYGKVIGYGASADAHHVTSPHPEGRGAELAVRAALTDAGMSGSDVKYVNAHGTSTPLNDVIESGVIRRVIGPDAAVSSTKGVTGHPLGAAGAIEAAFAALAAYHGLIPPTANLKDPDSRIDVDLVYKEPRSGSVDIALSNSFGFGGQNTALLIAA
ncbi:beta-ketoacyl-[acyl-carrier-protein] synthase family protein [Streptomyces sp. L7]